MDPSLTLLKYNSIKKNNHDENNIRRYKNKRNIILSPNIKIINNIHYISEPILFVNEKINYNYNFNINNIFIYQDALILANMDAIYNLLDMVNVNFIKTSNSKGFTYMIVNNDNKDKGGFIEYIQYRLPNSCGVGFTDTDWDYNYINANTFKPYDGYYLGKNLYYNWEYLIANIANDMPNKYELVICNSGISENFNLREKELNYVNIFIIQCIIGLSCSKKNFVVHCYDLTSNINAQIVYILSLSFNTIDIIKPISTSNSSDRYIICQGIKHNINDYINILKQSIHNINYHNEYVNSIYDNVLPKDFVIWLTKQNDDVLNYENIIKNNNYNINKISLIWHLPEYKEYQLINNYIHN